MRTATIILRDDDGAETRIELASVQARARWLRDADDGLAPCAVDAIVELEIFGRGSIVIRPAGEEGA